MLLNGAATPHRRQPSYRQSRGLVLLDILDSSDPAQRFRELPLPGIERGPIEVPEALPEVELRHLSRAVDAILVRAIREGCGLPLAQGLRREAELFGEVCATKDFRIGVSNFLENGPRAKAAFVHA